MTIAKTITFTATIAKGGIILLPEGSAIEGSTVEVILHPTNETVPQKQTPTHFVEKWAGFFKGADLLDLDDARYQRIKNKHVK
jgi:hypothetical protein